MADVYDIVVIGTGPGGYVCAIRASQLGLKVAVVEKRTSHGGTCLNVGCIPSKALLYASEKFHEAGNGLAGIGVRAGKPELDLTAMMAFKDQGVKGNTDGIAFLFKKNKVDVFTGVGRIVAAGEVAVTAADGQASTLKAKHIVLATGSEPAGLPGIDIDEETVVTSTGALALKAVPKHLVVVGGGVIGLELGSVWRRLGAEVTVVEYLDRILPGMDGDVVKQFERILKKQGLKFLTGHKLTGIDKTADGLKLAVEAVGDGKRQSLAADVALIAIGRVPFTDGLGLEDVGVRKDNRGRIEVNERFETGVAGIYAIGDVIAGPMLAHKAEDEGMALAELLAGRHGHVNYDTIPGVVYTQPELAVVGRSEDDLKAAGIAYKVGKFPFSANGRARVSHGTEGFVKVLADETTDRVLGVHIVGTNASEMIHEAAVLMEFGGSAEDLARICHAHPTLSEAVREAALAVDKRAIHI